jgi:hypothetical protein
MTRDPLYQHILRALNGDLDEDLFKKCAADLLRETYPTLVPMTGGDDGGYDGAIGTSSGPFPLLCTIDKRGPVANLRKNLATYVAGRNGPKFAIVATPRALSNRKKRNLERIAIEEFQVQIINVHEQTDFANRLYRDARWRLELLGLSGSPEALSALPPRSRAERPPIIGREDDLEWIRNTEGDLLLVGQPGIGKTYLHETLVSDGIALFAVDLDSERLANALRTRAPRVVIVDDAQESIPLLRTLQRLRTELGVAFRIHANCWAHSEEVVRAALELPQTNVRRIDLLTREQILDVVHECGVYGPDQLLHVLLDQAAGKPGLVAALVAAAKRGDLKRVWSGEALAELLLHGRQLLNGKQDLPVLAAFALAGDAGASATEVASAFDISVLDVRNTLASLAAGGVLEEVGRYGEHRVAVHPQALRGVLVRDAFYKGPERLDAAPVIEKLQSDPRRIEGLATTLLAARQRGANISNEVLLGIASEANSGAVWNHLAFVDASLSRALIRGYEDQIVWAADGLLHFEPEATLPHLLRIAASPKDSRSASARQSVKGWLEGDEPGDPVSIPRRRLLLAALKALTANSNSIDDNAHDWALALSIQPAIDAHRVPPGDGMKIIIYSGIRPLLQLREIDLLWSEVVAACVGKRSLSKELRQAIEEWCFPDRHARADFSDDTREFIKSVASRMLNELQELSLCGRVCRSWIRQTATRADLDVRVRVDRTFQRIFESRDFSTDWRTHERRRQKILTSVAEELAVSGPYDALHQLSEMEQEAATFGWHDGHDRTFLYYRLARSAADPVEWLRVAVSERLPPSQLKPFLDAAVASGREGLGSLLSAMLTSPGNEDYRQMTTLAVLSMSEPDEVLLDAALEALESDGHSSTFALVYSSPPIQTSLRLMQHPKIEIRVHSALAEWRREPKGAVRDELCDDWRSAILSARDEHEHLLWEVLGSDESLAFDWAIRKIDDTATSHEHRFGLWKLHGLFAKVGELLDAERRWKLLERIRPSNYDDEIIEALLRGDAELFRRWVRVHLPNGQEGHYMAFRPLDREIDETWERFAIVAADEGASPSLLSEHIHERGGHVVTGPYSSRYLKLIPKFERLASHPDHRLRQAGLRGVEWARARADRELRQERSEAIRGR